MSFFKKLTLYEKAQIAKRNHEKEVAKLKFIKYRSLVDSISDCLADKGSYEKIQYPSVMNDCYYDIKEHFEDLGFSVEYINGLLHVDVKDE